MTTETGMTAIAENTTETGSMTLTGTTDYVTCQDTKTEGKSPLLSKNIPFSVVLF